MNPVIKKENGIIPENLPHNNGDFKIPKKRVKTAAKIIIIALIILISAPRIMNNISSTLGIIGNEAEKFPTIFPTLTTTGISIGSFVSEGLKDVGKFFATNLATVGDLLYQRKITDVTITGTQPLETGAKPIRIIIDEIGVDSTILNPETTNITVLDEALKYGVVRYPESGLLGENDNVFLFGHNTSIKVVRNQAYKALNGLKNLKQGDIIRVQSEKREYLYKVFSVTMEKDSDVRVEFNTGKRMLTISTCNTLGAKEDRYVVEADFVISYPISNDIAITDSTPPEETVNERPTVPVQPTIPTQPAAIQPTQESHSFTRIPIEETIGGNIISPTGPKADLEVEITEIGILDPETNDFIATSTLRVSDKIAFKFIISNLGAKTAEGWSFNVVLPTNPLHIYHSQSQQNLMPGEKIEYALGFDRPQEGKNVVIIVNADPTRGIQENDESNNIVKKFITILPNE